MAEMMNNDLPKTEEVAKSAAQKAETEAPKKRTRKRAAKAEETKTESSSNE